MNKNQTKGPHAQIVPQFETLRMFNLFLFTVATGYANLSPEPVKEGDNFVQNLFNMVTNEYGSRTYITYKNSIRVCVPML